MSDFEQGIIMDKTDGWELGQKKKTGDKK